MSTLVIDTIQGKTTAGSINVRGEGSNNTNLQQGLNKAWINLNGYNTAAIRDSFNISSFTDNGYGDYTVTINNDMANANHVVLSGQTTYDGAQDTRWLPTLKAAGAADWSNYTATAFRCQCKQVANGGAGTDHSLMIYSVVGDLA